MSEILNADLLLAGQGRHREATADDLLARFMKQVQRRSNTAYNLQVFTILDFKINSFILFIYFIHLIFF